MESKRYPLHSGEAMHITSNQLFYEMLTAQVDFIHIW